MVCKKHLTLSAENVLLCRKFPTQALQVKKSAGRHCKSRWSAGNFLLHICLKTEHFVSLLHLLIHLDNVHGAYRIDMLELYMGTLPETELTDIIIKSTFMVW